MQRVVFDTTVVISALLFRSGRLAWLRGHWRDGGCVPLISSGTANEFAGVLRYKKFGLSTERLREALASYLPHCEIVEVQKTCSVRCRDARDQMFLDLAHSGRAEGLVSGNRDLLVLAGRTKFAIETPEAYRLRAFGV